MSDLNIFNNVSKDLQLVTMGVNILINKMSKESKNENPVITSEIKESIVQAYQIIERMAKEQAGEHFKEEEKNRTKELRAKNEKIRKLEEDSSGKIKNEDFSFFARKKSEEIRSKASSLGLWTSPDFKIGAYGFELKLEYISSKQNDTKYASSQEEIDEINAGNIHNKEQFLVNFDVSSFSSGSDQLIRMTERNIKTLTDIANSSGLNFSVVNVSNSSYSEDYDLIRTITFFANSSEPLSFKSYFGD